jgi:hypothetical protein
MPPADRRSIFPPRILTGWSTRSVKPNGPDGANGAARSGRPGQRVPWAQAPPILVAAVAAEAVAAGAVVVAAAAGEAAAADEMAAGVSACSASQSAHTRDDLRLGKVRIAEHQTRWR